MQPVEHCKRRRYRHLHVGQRCPDILVVRLDYRVLFGDEPAKAKERIRVRIDEMMDDLSDTPTCVTIGCIERFVFRVSTAARGLRARTGGDIGGVS